MIMQGRQSIVSSGKVTVTISSGSRTAEEWADLAMNKIVYIGENAHPVIRAQAEAFQARIRAVLVNYFKMVAEEQKSSDILFVQESGAVGLAEEMRRR